MTAVAVDLRQRLTTLVEHGPDLVIRFDRELRHVYASPAVESIIGLPPASAGGWTIRELGLPDELCDLWERELGAVRTQGLPRRFECWLDRPTGRRRLELNAVPEWGPDGRVESVVSFIRDRTEVHRREVEQHAADVRYRQLTHTAREALEESERRFRSAFDEAAVGMMLTDADGVLVRVNAAFARMLGRAAEALARRPVQELTFPEDAPLTDRSIELMRSGRADSVVIDKRYVRADGEIVWGHVGVSVVRDRDGSPVQFVAQVEDVTELRRLERELAETQALHEVVIESSSDLIAVLGLDGTIRLVSRSAEQILGYAPDELVGRPVADVFAAGDLDGVHASFAAALADGSSALDDSRVRTRDGSVRLIAGTVSAGLDAAGSPAFIVLNVRDVTGQRRLEEQLRQAQRMEAVGNLAGGIAHDFNNLLTAINGYSDLVLAALGGSGSAVQHHVEEIRRAGERAADLTRQLLAFSRQQILKPEIVDLNEVVSGYLTMLQRLVREDIRLQADLDPDLPPLLADRSQIGQVLLNLVVNARDAMPDGGDLRISTACDREAAGGPWVSLAVADGGVGILPEVAEHIFEPFFTTKPVGQGTGMGLSTVHGVVEQSGGTVSVESSPGAGATFVVRLPAAESAPPPLDAA